MPKFKVGEQVIIQSHSKSGYNGEITTILAVRNPEMYEPNDGQYGYKCDIVPLGADDWSEVSLRKLPPKQELVTWENLASIFVPKIEETVCRK